MDATLLSTAISGLHGEHDIVLHRPLQVGEPLQTTVFGFGARPAGRNAALTLRYATTDADGALVAEQLWTTIWLGVSVDAHGESPPDHTMTAEMRSRPIASYDARVDLDMPRRYAEVSGDWSPHHFDLEAARQTGFDRLFVQGLCTLGLCAQGVVATQCDGDPRRVRRLAVRFAAPAFVGDDLSVAMYDAGDGRIAFEATSGGRPVITHGLVELRR
jgi:acyl dehydratase